MPALDLPVLVLDLYVVLLPAEVDADGLVTLAEGFLWLLTVLAGAFTVAEGLPATAVPLFTAALAGAELTRVAFVRPLVAAVLVDTLLAVADPDLDTLLLVPMPPLVETRLVNTRSDPVWRLPPCQRSSW